MEEHINLEKIKIDQLDNRERFSIDRVLEEIEVALNVKVTDQSLLFIDEIQNQPLAINALRYFFEERPQLRVIAAGSLLEVVLAKEDFSMPVGRVDFLNLGPMSFQEFLKLHLSLKSIYHFHKVSLLIVY